MTGKLMCSIVLPLFNNAALTAQCLESIWAYTDESLIELIAVDNGSSDGTAALLDRYGDRLQTVRNAHNLGFARACNQGAGIARHEVLLFLNNDTLVQPGWLTSLLAVLAARPKVAVAGSRLFYEGGRLHQHAGMVFRYDDVPVLLYRGFPESAGVGARSRFMQAVTGACLAVRREVFAALGGFDEIFVNGCEDVDLCLRVRRAGGDVWYEAGSRVIHLESMTAGRAKANRDNMRHFRERWGGRVERDMHRFLRDDGFEVINPKARSLVLLKENQVFKLRSGRLNETRSFVPGTLKSRLRLNLLRWLHLPNRLRYSRRMV